MKTVPTWHEVLNKEKQKPYFIKIINNISSEINSGITIYPPKKEIFNAFRFTKLEDIKVVILGQDPYHGRNQAHGLAFSVRPSISPPPSLVNIYKELENSITGFTYTTYGCLESWARQGVMLLNTVLTVRAGQAHSHANIGWEIFTDKVIYLINKHCKEVVFLLWGSHAHKKEELINSKNHYILKAAHPSPISANRGFFGCNHFILSNKWLKNCGKKQINWMPIPL